MGAVHLRSRSPAGCSLPDERTINRRPGNGRIGSGPTGAHKRDVQGGLPVTAAPTSIPSLDVDPFRSNSSTILTLTQQRLREAGPLVYLDKWNVYGVARYAEVHAVLNDPLTFCSSRGVGLSDFAKEKPWRPPSIILEADPPAHTRTRAVLEPGAVADRDEAGSRPFRRGGRRQGRRIAGAAEVSMPSPISRRPIRCRCFPTRSA